MADQLLWLETLVKGGLGLIMLFVPLTAAKVAGLPHGNSAFWPRLFGVALIAMAGAFALQGYTQFNPNVTAGGLGLGGAIVINGITILSLIGTMIFKGVATRRGRALIWSLSLMLTILMLFEIANV